MNIITSSFSKVQKAVNGNGACTVQMALMVEMVKMLQQCQQTENLPDVGEEPRVPEKTAEVMRLEKMGFSNAAPVAENRLKMERYWQDCENHKKRLDEWHKVKRIQLERTNTVSTLIKARQIFGNDTLLVPYADFERLMRKYDLVCGPFSSYKGEIPADKVEEIERLERLTVTEKCEYINLLAPITGLICESVGSFLWKTIPSYIKRFPFIKLTHNFYGDSDMHGNKICDRGNWRYKGGLCTKLFICAPSRHMNMIRAMLVPRPAGNRDPFICAHTDYGILVFVRWGEEADDAIVKKHEEINRLIDGLSVCLSSVPRLPLRQF